MVSFRFHLVSLVAVFFALGLGVLTGTTVLNRGIVAQLERQTEQLVDGSERLREEAAELRAEVEGWDGFGEEVAGFVTEGRLAGREIVLFTQEGTDTPTIERVRRGLEEAGATLLAVVSVSERMSLSDETAIRDLGVIVGSQETDPDRLAEDAARAIAERMVVGATASDALERLLDSGFLLNRGPGLGSAAVRQLGGMGQTLVVVAGGAGEPLVEPDAFLVPLVRAAAQAGGTVAAGESVGTDYTFVGRLRSDAPTSGLIVTQDNVDQIPGGVGLVLGIEDLIEDRRSGHYGVKDGADGAIPSLT